jgi:hypothetical protein
LVLIRHEWVMIAPPTISAVLQIANRFVGLLARYRRVIS